ncbi:MAG: response regulator [Dehalococcoidales bacterium]|nr:response regulator [Dehalococcoidales bacterium]
MKILLIEDNPGDVRLIQEILKETGTQFQIYVSDKLESGLRLMESQSIDIILLDMNLPDSRGLETVTCLQEQFSHLPIVVMTSTDDTELAVQAMRLGVQDYLVKGKVDSEILRRSLVYASERKRAEEAILKSKEEWELTFNSVPDLIAILDCQHRIIRANKAMADRLRVPPEKCAGLYCFQVIHGLSSPPDFCPHSLTCQDGKEHITDVHEPRLGGDFLVSTTPIHDKQGKTTGSIHVARDITDRKQAEESLRHYTRELEAINKELESFSYTVSHDLRAPLRSIDGFSNILLEDYSDKLDVQGKDYLERICNSSKVMSRLIEDILTLSRITRTAIETRKVNLSLLAEEAAADLKRAQPERKADFKITPGIEVQGDRNLLKLALENLLENAFKFTGKREGALIEFGIKAEGKDSIYFVRDNGAGFNMDYAEKLFQPFQRLHSTSEFPGTGVGLATVQRIINRHGGKVWAEGENGKGATFYFTLG